jgi:hypothetical protein
MEHQSISKTIALAVFSSDAISSHRYADRGDPLRRRGRRLEPRPRPDTLIPIGIAVALLLTIVITSYRQTIFAYPSGRWKLRRQSREPRREPVARRGRVAARRLHPHGRGVDLGGASPAIISIPQFHDSNTGRASGS